MARIANQKIENNSNREVQAIFDNMKAKMGRIPNIFLALANSPNALKAFVELSKLCETCSLSKELQEEIALCTAQTNNCSYCLAAHSAIAKSIGISPEDIIHARKASSKDHKRTAILHFVKNLVQNRGKVSQEDVQKLKEHKVSDQEICDILLVVNLNFFTNYFNNAIAPEIDFPKAIDL